MAGLLRETVRLAVYDWIRDDAPTAVKMVMDKSLCDKLVLRVLGAIQSQSRSQ